MKELGLFYINQEANNRLSKDLFEKLILTSFDRILL